MKRGFSLRMRILFIKLNSIGDVLLMTPTLNAVRDKFAEARIDVLVRRNTEGILAGCPAVDEIYVTSEPFGDQRRGNLLQDLLLLSRLRRNRYDHVVLFTRRDRSVFMGKWTAGKQIHFNAFAEWEKRPRKMLPTEGQPRFDWRPLHAIDADYFLAREVFALPEDAPALDFTTPDEPRPDLPSPDVVIHPTSRLVEKEWPVERWREVVRQLTKAGRSVLLSTGPNEREIATAETIVEGVPGDIHLSRGRFNWTELATILKRTGLFLGVDTAAMHLAAACHAPVVALFGPSREDNWAPTCDRAIILIDPGFSKPANDSASAYNAAIGKRRTDKITVAQVLSAVL